MLRVSAFALLIPVLISGAALAAESLATIVPTENTNAVLHNPDMGWVVYENYPLDPDPHGSSTMLGLPDEHFPEVDAVALMFSWQDIEAREGVYDFSKVDEAYDYWRKRGKTIQLRLSAESLMYWAHKNPPAGKGVPDYVLAQMAPGEKQSRNMDGAGYVVVEARNPVYRARLSKFLQAVREHFDARRPVTLVDLRGFGAWGEWHSGFRYPNSEARRTALTAILDLWAEALPEHTLSLSYSYDPDGPRELYAGPARGFHPEFTTNYAEFLRFSAFDHALAKANITFRRDGCGGAVHSNERKLNEEAFFRLRRAPMFGEFLGGYGSVKQGGTNWVNWMVEDALSLHPNYLCLIGWQGADARDFARERPDLIAHGLRHMGYRLVPTRVQYPKTVTNGIPFEVRFDWVNRGVGRALRDYEIVFVTAGAEAARQVESAAFRVNTSQWLKGSTYPASHVVKFEALPPGEYRLRFKLRDPGTKRLIALPLADGAIAREYELGTMQVKVP